MKIAVINGSPRKGNTYAITRLFKNEMMNCGEIEFIEFFLPKDLPRFCTGCFNCFTHVDGEYKCPHAEFTIPILNSMLEADALIFTSPVYVLSESGGIKAFLDHYGFIFIVHRARPEMFSKKAYILSTTAGAGTGNAIKTIKTSLQFWGINRVYSSGFSLRGNWDNMPDKRHSNFETKIKNKARNFYREISSGKRHSPYVKIRIMFYFLRNMIKKYDIMSSDKQYWLENNWFKTTPFK